MTVRLAGWLRGRILRAPASVSALAAVFIRPTYVFVSFLSGLILARHLRPTEFGTYSLVLASATLLSGLAQLGLPAFLVRELSANMARGNVDASARLASASWRVASLAAVVGLFAMLVQGGMAGWDMLHVAAIVPAMLLIPLSATIDAGTRGTGRPLAGQYSEFLVRPGVQLVLLVAMLLFWPDWGTAEALASVSFAAAIAFGASLCLFRGALPAAQPIDLRHWARGLGKFTAAAWLNMLNLQLGLIVVGYISLEAAAEYRISNQVAGLLALGLAAMNTHYAPAMSAAHSLGNTRELQRLATTTARVSLALAGPPALLLVLVGGPVLSLLYGPGYADAALPLAVLVVGQVVNATTGSVGQLLMSTRNERPVLLTLLGAIFVNVAVSLLLIPAYGATGAAIATAASMAFWNTCLFVLVYTRLGIVSAPWGKCA